MEKYLKIFQNINDNKELRNEVDNFIIENDFDKSALSEEEYIKKQKQLTAVFSTLSSTLSKNFGIDRDNILLYFSFDKKLFPKIKKNNRRTINRVIYAFLGQARRSVAFNGSNIGSIYSQNHEDIIDFLHTNADLFPAATKKYILSKSKQRKTQKSPKFDKINNEFQGKMFLSSLPEEVDTLLISRYFLKFQGLKDYTEKTYSLFYLLLAISNKYKAHSDNETLRKNKNKVITSFLDTLNMYLFYYIDTGLIADKPSDIISKIVSNNFVLNTIIDSILVNSKLNNHVYLFIQYVKDKEDINELNEIIFKSINQSIDYSVFKFGKANSTLQKLIVEDSKKQWLDEHPLFIKAV